MLKVQNKTDKTDRQTRLPYTSLSGVLRFSVVMLKTTGTYVIEIGDKCSIAGSPTAAARE